MVSIIPEKDIISEFDTQAQIEQRERVKNKIFSISDPEIQHRMELEFLAAKELDKIADDKARRSCNSFIASRLSEAGEHIRAAQVPDKLERKRLTRLTEDFINTEEGMHTLELTNGEKDDRWVRLEERTEDEIRLERLQRSAGPGIEDRGDQENER